MSSKSLVLGTDENFFDQQISERLRSQHMHVLGATGSGKSRFLLSLVIQDILNNRGLCLIDPHGELVGHVTDWLAQNEEIAKRRKIRILDLKDKEWSFGFNPLSVSDDDRLEAVVDYTVSGIASVMGGDDLTQTPLLRLSLNAVCVALASAGLTLNEAPYLLSPDFPEERFAITDCVRNPTYAKVWQGLNAMAEKQPKLYTEQFQPAERRFIPFIANRFVRSILGQSEKTIDLKQSMDEGEILLVDLSREGGFVTAESSIIIGRLLVNNMVARAYERSPHNVRSFNLYIDEVQNYLSGDIPDILSQCRKFGLHLTIAHQYLQQLREAGELIYHGVMGTARNKVVFALDNPEDAEIMQRRIFVGQYDFERPKKSLIKPTVIGHEIINLMNEAKSDTSNTTTTNTTNTTRSEARGEAYSEGYSSGETSGAASSLSEMTGTFEGEDLGVTRHSQSTADFGAQSSGESHGSSNSIAVGLSQGQGLSEGNSQGTSSSQGYSQALKPVFEYLPTAVYSKEEQQHIFTDSIISLPNRTAFAVLAGEGLTKIETLDVPDLVVSPQRKKRIVNASQESSGIHKRAEEVEEEITIRFENFIKQSRQFQSPRVSKFNPSAPLDDPYTDEPPAL